MNLRPRKLSAAHALLVELLSAGRSMAVASCITIAAEHGLSMRTLYEARRRLPVECDRAGDGPGLLAARRRTSGLADAMEAAPVAQVPGLQHLPRGHALAHEALPGLRWSAV